ncbi:type I phosphomannose isomerase catalytic subunit [Robiginitalea aurantiaca]|uniref:Phosphohexomutase n=1 Tax=Robiginitalea aurantiaca TaxID=3056915 RepID=A0ABT7WGE6_9FLAO|nr:type I phosphomannose isomerase catalytic subunit [Robiginitalea aurantiaca]MDM9631991.1 class I mannose-6-phosphate isomerase [Robiginitalea aurantiaca]
MNLYPLKFKPILKERLWGGEKLREVLGKDFTSAEIGESWEISGVEGDVSTVANGPYEGKSLNDLISAHPEDLLGSDVVNRFGLAFPILIKFIDAKKDLSIQLHPDDELARKRHNSFGKTEMWYVMDADPGAELIIGFKNDLSREEFQKAMDSKSLTDYLHYEPVQSGDTYLINSGKIHAIGAGILLAEIQQSSDVTYRVYDFDRRDSQGNLRELHTDLAVDAMDFKKKDDFRIQYSRALNRESPMVSCEYFKTSYLDLDSETTMEFEDQHSFTVLICVQGNAQLVMGSWNVPVEKGETVLIPASAKKLVLKTSQSSFLKVSL